jgi:hypothetical protein
MHATCLSIVYTLLSAACCVLANASSHTYALTPCVGFEVLAFPCNQFGGQEPTTAPEVVKWAEGKFGTQFQIFDKIDVTGPPHAHPAPLFLLVLACSCLLPIGYQLAACLLPTCYQLAACLLLLAFACS